MAIHRRRFLTACGVAGTALLAGCSGADGPDDGATRTRTPTPTEQPRSRFITDDGVVDYPGMVNGAATVESGESDTTIVYSDPDMRFALLSGFEGDTDPSELRVSRHLSVDVRAGFVAPIYDDAAGTFVYQVFANQAFVDYADWNFVTVGQDGSLSQEGAVPFERAQGRIHAAGVRPGRIRRLFVVDQTAQTLREEGPGSLSGIVMLVDRSGDGTATPTSTATTE